MYFQICSSSREISTLKMVHIRPFGISPWVEKTILKS